MIDYNEILKFIVNMFTFSIPIVITFVVADKLVNIFKNFISGKGVIRWMNILKIILIL